MEDFFSNTNETLLLTKDSKKDIIDHYKPDMVVCESEDGFGESRNPGMIYINYREMRTLLKYDSGFFISGVIIAIYSEDSNKAAEEYGIMRKCILKGNKVIHVSENDFIISKSSGKTISLDIDGKVVR